MQDKLLPIIMECRRERLTAVEQTARIIAALPDMVEPLVWINEKSREPNIFGIVCEAKTSFPGDGDYIIYDEYAEENASGELEMTSLIDEDTGGKFYFGNGQTFSSLEDAKDAAQADYTRRVLSAFGITPDKGEECQSTAFDSETECCLSCGKRH